MTETAPKDSDLIGVAVEMPNPCKCGDDIAVTGPGAGPHIASVLCASCGKHRSWLSKAAADLIRSVQS
jgi:hypothetical protein